MTLALIGIGSQPSIGEGQELAYIVNGSGNGKE